MEQRILELSKKYLERGINVLPFLKADRPRYPSGWKFYQTNKILFQTFFDYAEKLEATHVAAIAGKVSNNLFCIDLDCKYNLGVEVLIFEAIKKFDNTLFEKLRIHKTKSGGYHLLYFIASENIFKSEKLATKKETNKVFIETKGEGALFTVLGEGYGVYQNKPFPTLTENEHACLINICKSFNEVFKTEKQFKQTKIETQTYSENPREAFNERGEIVPIVEKQGWTKVSENASVILFSKPNAKVKEPHASFSKKHNTFYVHTTDTDLEPNKGYHAYSLLAKYNFNDDHKAAYKWLLENGFGKFSKKIQEQKIEQAISRNQDLTTLKQIDEVFLLKAQNELKEVEEKLPFGKFWHEDRKDFENYKINRQDFLNVVSNLGFVLYKNNLCVKHGKFLKRCTERDFQDIVKNYVWHKDSYDLNLILNSLENFYQKSTQYIITRLPILLKENVIHDERDCSYKFFSNCWLKISSNGIEKNDYETLDKLVEFEKVKQFDFEFSECVSVYHDFLNNAVRLENKGLHVMRVIGYLAHDYKDETNGYIIVLSEEVESPQDGGGAGKNIFCNLLSLTNSLHVKNATQINYDEKFFQSWNGERLFVVSDVPKNFRYEFLNEPTTGKFTVKKLWQNEVEVKVEDGVKFIVPTNYSVKINNGGLKRRVINLEFTNFYTLAKGVDVYHKKHFTNDWTREDFLGYYNFINLCLKIYLKHGLKLEQQELSAGGWLKSFAATYPNLIEIFNENIEQWTKENNIEVKVIREKINSILMSNADTRHYLPSAQKQNAALKEYCRHYDCIVTLTTYRVPIINEIRHVYRFNNIIIPKKEIENEI